MKSLLIALIGLFAIGASYAAPKGLPQSEKQRLIVTTDLGGTDPDDTQSMIHLLVCSNMMDIEGLISSQVWMDDPDKTGKIKAVVEQFGEVLPRLRKHAGGYPDLDYLRSITLRGQEKSNMSGVGEGEDFSRFGTHHRCRRQPQRPPSGVDCRLGRHEHAGSGPLEGKPHPHPRRGGGICKQNTHLRHTGTGRRRRLDCQNFPDIVYIRNTQIYGWGPSDEWTKEQHTELPPAG